MCLSPLTVATLLSTALSYVAALQLTADKLLEDNLATQSCPKWCERRTDDWSVKCDFEDCQVCGPCPVDKEGETSPTSHQPTSPPTDTTTDGDQPSGQEEETSPNTQQPASPPTDTTTDGEQPSGQKCPRWCGRNKNPWVAKCQYDECKVCGPCPVPTLTPTPAPTHAPTVAPTPTPTELTETSPDEVIGNNCPRWCGRHPSPWSTKCTYDECKVCADCPAENDTTTSEGEEPTGEAPAGAPGVNASVDDDEIVGNNCPRWCGRHPSPWSTKCTYDECKVCTDCPAENDTTTSEGEEPTGEVPAEAPAVEAPSAQAPIDENQSDNDDQKSEGNRCPTPCQRHSADWSVKCGWEDCGVCEQCAASQGEEPVGEIPEPKVSAPTDEAPVAAPEADEQVCPEACAPNEAMDWAQQCGLELCHKCEPCLEYMHEVHTCMTHKDCDRSRGLYCGDPRSAAVEVNTCFTGLCICIELLPGHPNIVKVGDHGSTEEPPVDDSQSGDKEEQGGGKPVGPDPETHHATVEAGDVGVSANACPAVCVRNEAIDWPEKCGWDDCRQCEPCVEKVHNTHRCTTRADCDRSKNLYCADPRSAAIEVNTCFTGLCICIEALHGLPTIASVGR